MAPVNDPWVRWSRTRQSGRGLFILRYGLGGWGLFWGVLMSLGYWLLTERPEPGMILLIVPLGLVCGYAFGALTWRWMEDKYLAAHPQEAESATPLEEATGTVLPSEHPHIVRQPGVCGGSPLIRGTRITVRHVAVLRKAGETPEDIAAAYPHLALPQVQDAIGYYLDHKEEIEREIEENRIENVLDRTGGVGDENGLVRFPE